MTTTNSHPSESYECVWCHTQTTEPASGPGQVGGFTCQCGKTFHRPETNTQTTWEFLTHAAGTDLLPGARL